MLNEADIGLFTHIASTVEGVGKWFELIRTIFLKSYFFIHRIIILTF